METHNGKIEERKHLKFISFSDAQYSLPFSLSSSLCLNQKQQQQHQHQPDELHYAELSSITISRNYKSNAAHTSSGGGGGSTSSSCTGTSSNPNNAAMVGGPNGNFDIFTDKLGQNKSLPKKPPAYDYFNEPTVYAQIDHFKTMPSNVHHTASHSSIVGAIASSSSNSPAAANCGHNAGVAGIGIGGGITASSSTLTKKSPSNVTVSAYQMPHSLQLSNSNTLTFSSIQSPTSSNASYQNQATSTTSTKPFSREIVTIRTPLLYTQQESCV